MIRFNDVSVTVQINKSSFGHLYDQWNLDRHRGRVGNSQFMDIFGSCMLTIRDSCLYEKNDFEISFSLLNKYATDSDDMAYLDTLFDLVEVEWPSSSMLQLLDAIIMAYVDLSVVT